MHLDLLSIPQSGGKMSVVVVGWDVETLGHHNKFICEDFEG